MRAAEARRGVILALCGFGVAATGSVTTARTSHDAEITTAARDLIGGERTCLRWLNHGGVPFDDRQPVFHALFFRTELVEQQCIKMRS